MTRGHLQSCRHTNPSYYLSPQSWWRKTGVEYLHYYQYSKEKHSSSRTLLLSQLRSTTHASLVPSRRRMCVLLHGSTEVLSSPSFTIVGVGIDALGL
ncbi:hypothetical protein Ocin01_08763 [Orchesella cincta]|uniref:Uncharacterized protein n=1 Tax=Orchesella cincta TaxID=48709 RepID=A0A1D2MZ38_ORCCI|nr:hypothetical protein Ocin01_08763 [Orchesella cincta]